MSWIFIPLTGGNHGKCQCGDIINTVLGLMRQHGPGQEPTSRTWQTHRCFFRPSWSVAIGSFLSKGFFPCQHVLCQPVTLMASSSLSMRQRAANTLSHPSKPDRGTRKTLSFLLYTLQPQGPSSINTQRKTFYTNGNNR